ncbi:MAG: ArnT family glycosyltransferase, partial [Candidatus Omnitrophota bacterium]
MDKKKNIYIIILAITSAFFFFYKLGELPLLDPDEPRYAEVAREMGETNDFLVPYFNYQPRLKKPPLFYWLIFLAYKIFGINEFSARFPSALFAFMGVFLTYLMGKKLYSYFTGFLAGLILATSLEYLVLSRLAITDMVLCGFFLSCLFFFLKYRETRRDIFLLLFWISLALAFLTKGPVGLLPLLIGLFFMLSERDFSFLRVFFLRKIYFSSLFFILGLSWYVAVAFKFGFAEMFSLFRYETIERFGSGYIHREPFLYFIPVIL